MTLRIRLVALFALAFATGLALIALAHYTAVRMHRAGEALVSEDLQRARGHARIHDALHRIRRAQDRLVVGGGAFHAELVRQLERQDGLIDAAKPLMPREGVGSYAEMRGRATKLRGVAESIADRYGHEAREIDHLAARVATESARLRARLESFGASFKAGAGSEEHVAHLQDHGALLLNAHDPSATAPEEGVLAWGAILADQLEAVRALLPELARDGDAPRDVAVLVQLGEELEGFGRSRVDLVARRARLQRARAEAFAQRDELLDSLWAGADELITDLNRSVEERRVEIANARHNQIWILAVTCVVGFGLLGVLLVFLIAGIERDLAELQEVVRVIERGEIPPRARFERSTRELARLGASFYTLSTSLAAVRARQTAHDAIATGLNRSVQLPEILRSSLGELARATRSRVGCIYLKVTGRDELLLADAYGLPRGAEAPEIVRAGEGLVGEVLRDRKTLHLDDVPAGGLKVVSATLHASVGGVVLAPILYKDELMGVLELGGLSGYDADTVHFIEEVIFNLAVAINNARAVETIRTTASALEHKTEELEDLNAQLERANQLKSEFLASVSHELRTPLNSIIGFTELALDTDPTLSGTTRGNLQTVMRNAEQLLALINDLLELSKIEAGKVELRLEPLDFTDLVRQTVEDFGPVADAKSVELVHEAESLPRRVLLDRDKTRRIVQNLVSNAVKFTERGSVRVRTLQDTDRLLVEVRDTGIGIDPDNIPKIFEKFRQLDGSHARRFGGSGLGLAITKELCHAMGGSVRVSSREGTGSTFTVNLPLSVPEV